MAELSSLRTRLDISFQPLKLLTPPKVCQTSDGSSNLFWLAMYAVCLRVPKQKKKHGTLVEIPFLSGQRSISHMSAHTSEDITVMCFSPITILTWQARNTPSVYMCLFDVQFSVLLAEWNV